MALRRLLRPVAAVVVISLTGTLVVPVSRPAEAARRIDPPRAAAPAVRRHDRPVELPDRRTPHSRTYRNPDGTLTTEVYARPIHYRDGAGELQPIVDALVPDEGGTAVRNAANRQRVTFRNRAGGEAVTVEYQGRRVTMELVGARQAAARWRGPRLDYAGVMDHVDLRYAAAGDALKEEIVLTSPEVPQRFTFRLQVQGVRAEEAGDGSFAFRDTRTGELIWVMPRPYMRDAAGRAAPVAVSARTAGNRLELTLSPDPGWLRDPERAFPVVIDPSLVLAPDFATGMDTTLSGLAGEQDVNFGYDSTLLVGDNHRALLQFDLSAIPRASAIQSATLRLTNVSLPPTANTTGVAPPAAAPQLRVAGQTSGLAAGTYSVLFTYTTPQGETTPSPAASITIGDYQAIAVDAGPLPAGATGIKVYLGAAAGQERLAATAAGTEVVLDSLPPGTAPAPPSTSPVTYLPAPAAAPTVTLTNPAAGSPGFPAGTYYVRYTYRTAGGETTPSPAAAVTVPAPGGKALQVNVGTLPPGAVAAHIYVGTSAEQTFRTATATAGATTQTLSNPPALTTAAGPAQAPAVLPDPTAAPSVTALTGDRPFPAGTYTVAYTFYSPAGETAPSPTAQVTLSAGGYMRVTAGEPLPPGATGMRVYVGRPGEPLYLAATQPAVPADAADSRPTATVEVPPGFRFVRPPATSKYSVSTGPSLTARTLTTPTRLKGGTYYVSYTHVYWDGESTPSPAASITITDGQAIEVNAGSLPTGAIGIRVYVGATGAGKYLAAATWGNKALVTGEGGAPTPPAANTTRPPAPAAAVTTLSALPAGTYAVAYTFTSPTGESAPSPAATVQVAAGQTIQVTLPPFPAGVTGANIYVGTPGGGQRLALGTTDTTAVITALPAGTAALLSPEPRGGGAPDAPAAPPALTAATPSRLPAGTYSVRYTFTGGHGETAPSQAATVTVTAGQAITVRVPALPPGATGAHIYAGPPGAERLAVAGAAAGTAVQITEPPTGAPLPETGTGVPAAPAVSTAAGGAFSGDLYISYSFYNTGTGRESWRSPETFRTFSGTLTLTTGPVPAWADAVRVYAGPAAGDARLVETAPATPGAPATVTVTAAPPGGVGVYAVTSPWSESSATWQRSSDRGLWLEAGGDHDRAVAVAALGTSPQVTVDLTRLVSAWVSGALPNHGILLRGAGAPVAFAATDDPDPDRRPVLSITYREVGSGPQVTLTAPAPGSAVSGLVTLAASVSAEPGVHIERVDFYANGSLVGTATAPPYQVQWDTALLPSGTYQLEARAYDQWGQEGRSSWTPVLTDTFTDLTQVDAAATTALIDPATGVATLPVEKTPVAIRHISASSARAPESYPAGNLLDNKDDTVWRSPGRPAPDAQETVTLKLNSSTTSVSLTIKPHQKADGLTVKLQGLDSQGRVIKESAVTTLDADAKTVSLSTSSAMSYVRLVFSNLRRNVVTGLYHAEVRTIYGPSMALADGPAYSGQYGAELTADGNPDTAWVSGDQGAAGAQEYLDLDLAAPANALYLRPRTPGVAATVSVASGQTYQPVLHIPTLTEGLWLLPAGVSGSRLRLTFTNLVGNAGPGAAPAYLAGIAEVTPYAVTLARDQAVVESQDITLPAPAGQFLLQAAGAQPVGTGITYSLFDGATWHPVTPGVPLTLDTPAAIVRLRATLTTGSPAAVPTLTGWQLYTVGSHPVALQAADGVPPAVQLLTPAQAVLSGTVTLRVAAWDNVGVTRVELLAGNDEHTVLAESDTPPFDLTLDTTRLTPGTHLLWVRAYDAAGNVGTSRPPTTTYQAFSDTFNDYNQVDLDASRYAAVAGGAARNSTGEPRTLTLSGTGSRTASFSATPGLIEIRVPVLQNSAGQCVAAEARLYYTYTVYDSSTDTYETHYRDLARDRVEPGECRELYVRYPNPDTRTLYASVSVGAVNPYTATVTYFGPLGTGYDYGEDTLVSRRAVTAGPIAGATLRVTESKPAGTGIDYYISADDGFTWEPIVPGQYTPLRHSGNRLRLMAVLRGAAGSGFTYNNLTPQLLDWSVDVTQYVPHGMVTVSQVDPPRELQATLAGSEVQLAWQPSAEPGVTYNVYRSTSPGPRGRSYLVATGVTGTTLTDGYNLLRNSSFERVTQTGAILDWSGGTTDTTDAVAGDRSLRLTSGTASQTVIFATPFPAGTTFSLSARVKGAGVQHTSGYSALTLTLTYTDNTTATARANAAGGTFDWLPARTSLQAAKPVKSVTVTLSRPSAGTLWFDTVQLDTQGAGTWVEGGIDPSQVYYYQVTAVRDGVESAPSNEAATAAPAAAGLGLKAFWPYAGVQLAGGEGYVNLWNGNLVYTATDLLYPSRRLALTFRRTYNSRGAGQASALGYGWDHNFNWTLTEAADGTVTLKEGDGARFTFTPAGDGMNYVTPPGARMRLVKGNGIHTLVRYDTNILYLFDAQGRLREVREPNGNALTLLYDEAGRLAAVRGPAGEELQFVYNAAGYIAAVLHPGDPAWQVRYDYDAAGNLVRATDLEGNSVLYGYDEGHRLVTVTDANRNTTQITYAGLGTVAQVTHAGGATHTFAYGLPGESGWTKTTVTDARGFVTQYQVDRNGLLQKQTFPYGTATPAGTLTASVSFTYDAAWNITQYTDPLGKTYKITYDGYGNILTVTDPLGNVTRHAWSVDTPWPGVPGQFLTLRTETTDALGHRTRYAHDPRGNLVRVEDALGQIALYTYDEHGLQVAATDPAGHTTRYEYDPDGHGWLLRRIDPLGGVTAYTYDPGGNPRTVTDPAGNTTTYIFDRLGRPKEIIHPDGGRRTFLYDGAGNLIRATDPAGAVTQYTYDARGRVVAVSRWPDLAAVGDPDRAVTTRYEYDAMGNPVAVVDPRGKRTTMTYDGAGRKLTEQDPLGKTTTYTYDAAGNLLSVRDPNGNTVTATYDALGRQTQVNIGQGTLSYTFAYDALGRKVEQKDALGNTTTYAYDALGRLVAVTDPLGFTTRYAYDPVGNRVAVVDAQRRTTGYAYDALGRLIREHRPDGTSVSYEYDPAGRLAAHTNARGQVIRYRRDPMGRVVAVDYPDNRRVTYAYDPAGRRTAMTDGTGTTRYRYDLLGRLLEVQYPSGHAVAYEYDPAGNRNRMTLTAPGATFVWTYTYDDAGRLTALQAPGVGAPDTFTYDAGGRLTRLNYANGDTVQYSYNKANLVTGITSSRSTTTIISFTYTYDQAGRRTQISRSGAGVVGSGTLYYKYDAGSRLTGAGTSSAASDREYYYDLVGNRHTLVVNTGDPKGVYTYVYDAANRLLEEFGPRPSAQGGGYYRRSYTYDADGNQIRLEEDGREVSLYDFDADGRLIRATNSLGQVTRYTYDGDGRRVRMDGPDGTTLFIHDGPEVLAEADATGAVRVLYTRMPGGRLISQWQRGETFWYHLDGLGSTIALTDEAGQVRNRYGYDEFGNPDPAGAEEILNRYTFTGQAWDRTVGLYYYKARYYNPQIGRFISQDTWKGDPWEPWTQNLYVYVGNNPVNYVDPTGHFAETLWDIASIGMGAYECWHDPGLVSCGSVIVDLFATVFPFIPGGAGAAVKAGKTVAGLANRADTAADVARKLALRNSGRELLKFTAANFRENLVRLTGKNPATAQAHHVFPQKFAKDFKEKWGIDIHNPLYGAWWDTTEHQKNSYRYQKRWEEFIETQGDATREEVLQFARELAKEFGFEVYF